MQNPEQAEDAIEHMCFLTDANRLYTNALGLYDLELTLLVAQQAQMVRPQQHDLTTVANCFQDPREYLPFLRKLQQLPETRRQFEIDNHLSRFVKALKHLYALGSHEELRDYVTKHVLYKEALDIYRYQPEQQREITHLYAEYLQGESKHKDAAIGKPNILCQYEHLTNSIQPTNHLRCTTRPINATTLPTCGGSLCTVP